LTGVIEVEMPGQRLRVLALEVHRHAMD
jgi:hypothetical protein